MEYFFFFFFQGANVCRALYGRGRANRELYFGFVLFLIPDDDPMDTS